MTLSAESLPAPAKLNLFLRVVGRRPDGYHLLQTVFRFVDLEDTVRVARRDDAVICLRAPLPGVPEERDLCVRAARLLQQATACGLGADIEVAKRIPMGGGLGGGSSDAATTLMALNRLWDLRLSRRELMSLGLRLGADVPVFLFGENAFGEGVGEVLTPVALPPRWYVVLVPPVTVPTAEIFADPHLTRNADPVKIPGFSVAFGINDLQEVVLRRYPVVARHLQWLGQFGPSAMTGSGACVFSEFESEGSARDVLGRLPADMNGFVARGLERHPLYELLKD